jgi:hypothetical protein
MFPGGVFAKGVFPGGIFPPTGVVVVVPGPRPTVSFDVVIDYTQDRAGRLTYAWSRDGVLDWTQDIGGRVVYTWSRDGTLYLIESGARK